MSAQRLRDAAAAVRRTTDQYPPGVGLALADWLDYTADLLAIAEAEDMVRERPFRHANAIADLILGGAA